MTTNVRRSVNRLANGRWRARYRDPRTSAWVSVGCHPRRADAQLALERAVSELRTKRPIPQDCVDMTFEEYATRVFWPAETLAASTMEGQLSLFKNHLVPRWGAVKLTAIDVEDIEHWVRHELPRQPLANGADGTIGKSAQRQVYWTFHKIIAKAHERGYLPRSPLPRKSGLAQEQPHRPTRILTPEEIERLARAVDAKDPSLIYTAAYGGFRCGELFGLRFDDLDFDRCNISVDEQVTHRNGRVVVSSDLKRARSHRVVAMPDLVMEMLAVRTMRVEDPRAFVFASKSGGPIDPANWRTRVFHPAVAAAGLPRMKLHDLRHTAASAWFDEGIDMVTVARLLGDSLAVAEETYVHFFAGRHDAMRTAMNRRIRRAQDVPSNVIPFDAGRGRAGASLI